jgi:uncharacterized protein
MKRTALILPILLSFLFACCQTNNSAQQDSWVFDLENILSDSQEIHLDSIIKDFEKRTTNEIAIVTVHDIGDSPKMVHYAVDFGEKYGVGKKDKDNGLVILFSLHLRQVFLATGYGTEEILKDEICKVIIDSTMKPLFKKGDYFGGLKAGLEECILKWE